MHYKCTNSTRTCLQLFQKSCINANARCVVTKREFALAYILFTVYYLYTRANMHFEIDYLCRTIYAYIHECWRFRWQYYYLLGVYPKLWEGAVCVAIDCFWNMLAATTKPLNVYLLLWTQFLRWFGLFCLQRFGDGRVQRVERRSLLRVGAPAGGLQMEEWS